MAEAHISDLLVEQVVLKLETALQSVDTDDPTYCEVVREGLLQENPLANRTSITAYPGDPDEIDQDAWIDQVAESGDPNVPFTPMFEVGRPEIAGIHMWRRGTIKGDVFLIKTQENRDESRRIANVIRGRIEQALRDQTGFTGLTDSFGEQVITFIPFKSYAREGGGPNQHIWRIYVWWQALTSRS